MREAVKGGEGMKTPQNSSENAILELSSLACHTHA